MALTSTQMRIYGSFRVVEIAIALALIAHIAKSSTSVTLGIIGAKECAAYALVLLPLTSSGHKQGKSVVRKDLYVSC
jgi:hypothetical protein